MDVVKMNGVCGAVPQSSCSVLRIWTRLRQNGDLPLLLSVALGMFLFGYANRVLAQLTILHSFGDGTVANDGAYPGGLSLAPNGRFFWRNR